jgi:OOP family OmpA-OmpF porin
MATSSGKADDDEKIFESSITRGKIAFFRKSSFTKKNMFNKLAFGLVIGAAVTAASAQTAIQAKPDSSAYLQDSRGMITRSQQGLCWRTSYWTPADAVPGCDGELVPPIAKPTAPAIVPPPVVAEAAPVAPIAPKRCDFAVTFSSDQAFAYNRAVLSNAAKIRIDQEVLPALASCSKVDAITITGHTDQLGSQQYNQRLSERRAEAVAAYLKSKGATARIDTIGAGKNQPIKSCDEKLPRSKLIDCLSPNRRVVIEIRGLAK